MSLDNKLVRNVGVTAGTLAAGALVVLGDAQFGHATSNVPIVSTTPNATTTVTVTATPSATSSSSFASSTPTSTVSAKATTATTSATKTASATAAKTASATSTTTSATATNTTTATATKTTTSATTSAGTSGTFTGEAAETRYGPVTVTITVSNGKVVSATATQEAFEQRSVEISGQAIPMLNSEVAGITNASNLGAISGATFTSEGYAQSLQSALDKAGIK